MAKYDWDYWRDKYITGNDSVTLTWLSTQPGAPSLHRFKMRSSAESWRKERENFRNKVDRYALDTVQNNYGPAIVREAEKPINAMISASEVIARHLKLAKALQGLAAQAIQQGLITAQDLSPRDVVSWMNQGIAIERLALDLATTKLEVSASKVDFKALSDEQIERLAQGEDLDKVVAA